MKKLLPYLITLLCVASISLLKVGLNKLLGIDSPLLLFFTGITFCAWWGGAKQGVFASILTVLSISFVFLDAGEPAMPIWWMRFVMFMLDATVVIYLCSQLRYSNLKIRKVYREMETSEKSLRKVFESNMIGLVYSDFNGQLIKANDYLLDLLQMKRSDLDQGLLNWKDFTPPEFMEVSVRALESLRTNQGFTPFEKEYLRRDGSRVTILVGSSKVEDNMVVAFILDISDRKRSEQILSQLNNRLEESVKERTRQLTDMNEELTKLVKESLQTEERLRQSEDFLDSVIENIPNMIFVKRANDLRFVRLNKAGSELLGHPQQMFIGKNDHDFFPPDQAEFFISKDREVLEGKRVVDIAEETIATPEGARYLHTKKIPLFDKDNRPVYLLGISEDITEKKEAEKQRSALLHEQSARWEAEKSAARLSFLADASAALNKSLEIPVMVNAFLEVITENFAESCCLDIIDEHEGKLRHLECCTDEHKSLIETTLDLKEAPDVGQVIESGAAILSASKIMLPLVYRQEVFACLTLVAPKGHTYDGLDVSMARDLARRAAIAIENANLLLKAQDASRTKSAFLANMSHEIRTPLGAMLGFAELALDDPALSQEQANHLTTILRNGNQLLRIVDEVLDLSKVESDRIEIEKINVALPKLFSEINLLFSLKAEEKGLKFTITPKGLLPAMVKTDPLRLRQILINIVGNALKFTEKGGVELTVEYRPSSPDPLLGTLEISVKDSGIGISAEQVTKLFQPFVQADPTTTRKYGGTGLGLFLSRRLAALMGGNVELQNAVPGKGSEFRISLPLEIVGTQDNVGEALQLAQASWSLDLPHAGKVLIVDDALENRVLVNAFLSKMGVATELAVNGKEAVEKALHGEFDVVLMDIQMPVMDGFEAVKRLREQGYRKTIVALTAHAMKGDREKCLNNGFNDYLCKPINREALAQCLVQHMNQDFRAP